MQIFRQRRGVPDTQWIIVRCKACGELSLVEPGAGIASLKLVDCEWVQALSKEEYRTRDQALVRLHRQTPTKCKFGK